MAILFGVLVGLLSAQLWTDREAILGCARRAAEELKRERTWMAIRRHSK